MLKTVLPKKKILETVMNYFHQGCIKMIKSDCKTFILLQKISNSNKYYSFAFSIFQRLLKKASTKKWSSKNLNF